TARLPTIASASTVTGGALDGLCSAASSALSPRDDVDVDVRCLPDHRVPSLVSVAAGGVRLPGVPLDGSLVADARLVGVQPGGPAGAALVQEVPALVEGHLEPLHPLPLGVAHLPVGLP